MNLSTSQLRMLGSVMYFAAVVLIINYFAQFTIQVWPLKFGELNWRAGATGLLLDVLLSTMIPQVLMYFAGFINEDRKMLRFLSIVSMIVGIVTLGLLLMFALDSIQLRAQLPQNLKAQFMKVALRAGLVGTLLSALSIWVGLTIGKVLKSQGTARVVSAAGASDRDGMLMVGSREPSRPNLRAIDGNEPKGAKKESSSAPLSVEL